MIQSIDTRSELLAAGRQLFAEHGFRGTTVRALADRAGTNIGAITYHFGSKLALYHSVLDEVTRPVRERLGKEIQAPEPPLDRIENHLRANFAFLGENPDISKLIFQQLVGGGPLPPAAKTTLQMNLDRIVEFIEAGQRAKTIRKGDARLMALSFGGLPLLLSIYGDALREAADLDQENPAVRARMVDTVVSFVRAGLAKGSAAS